ncbi:hypothetical protein DFH06DRAFT_1476398 [Mycena polygramma]|nr:hypothetical protein DFH06DRAFT_1476398 [Mycena polygramma]
MASDEDVQDSLAYLTAYLHDSRARIAGLEEDLESARRDFSAERAKLNDRVHRLESENSSLHEEIRTLRETLNVKQEPSSEDRFQLENSSLAEEVSAVQEVLQANTHDFADTGHFELGPQHPQHLAALEGMMTVTVVSPARETTPDSVLVLQRSPNDNPVSPLRQHTLDPPPDPRLLRASTRSRCKLVSAAVEPPVSTGVKRGPPKDPLHRAPPPKRVAHARLINHGQGNDKPGPVDDDGEPEVDAKLAKALAARKKAAARFFSHFSLPELRTALTVAQSAVSISPDRNKTLYLTSQIDSYITLHLEQLSALVDELWSRPLGPAAPLAAQKTLSIVLQLTADPAALSAFDPFVRQRIMISRALVYQWLERFIVPELRAHADTIILEPRPETAAAGWLDSLIRQVHDVDALPQQNDVWSSVVAANYSGDLCNAKIAFKCAIFGMGENAGILFEITRKLICKWLGFPDTVIDNRDFVAARFIADLYDSAGAGALVLEVVWDAFWQADKRLAGCTSSKKHPQVEELSEWHLALMAHPIANKSSAERQMLDSIAVEYDRIHQHKKLALLPALRPKLQPHPENLLLYLRLALILVPKRRACVVLPSNMARFDSRKRRILEYMFENADHCLPIRSSTDSFRPLLVPGGPLDVNHLRTVSGLFSVALYRAMTCHSPFARHRTFFSRPKDFLDAVVGLPLTEFVVDPKILGNRSYERYVVVLWETVCDSAANWWVLGQPRPPPVASQEMGKNASTSRPVAKPKAKPGKGKKKVPPPPTPTYEEVLASVTNTEHPKSGCAMCGPFAGHLLAADYADAGVCKPPNESTLASTICSIDGGAFTGLAALDYFYDATALGYVKQRAFCDLYRYLEAELTANEKECLNWSPICLEYALRKYVRIIAHPAFVDYFTATSYTAGRFGPR